MSKTRHFNDEHKPRRRRKEKEYCPECDHKHGDDTLCPSVDISTPYD